MRIAQIAPLAERIPPKAYGGTERIIYLLTEELVKRGHEVTLFASGDSLTSAKLESVYPISLKEAQVKDLYGFNLPTMLNMGTAYGMQDQFDIIHDHNPAISLPTANLVHVPVVCTWHGPYSEGIINYFSHFKRPYFVGISKSHVEGVTGVNLAGVVYNGLKMDHFPFSETHDDYLLFVGRMDPEKGPHIAIDVAVTLGKKLIMGAKYDSMVPHIREYFEQQIKPRLDKHKDLVEWVGEVNEEQRNMLMSKALCFLHPVQWPEPFGLTLVEANACGCPVIALRQGAIPEILADGKTGFIVRSEQEIVDAVLNIDKIDRTECRKHALEKFSVKEMADGYEKIYQDILSGQPLRKKQ